MTHLLHDDTLEPFVFDLTPEEKRAISTLHWLAKKWPSTLWVFCTGGFNVMRYKPDGSKAINGGEGAGMDQRYVVDTIDIPNDGGAW